MILKRFTKQDFQPFGDLIAPDAGGESANQGRAMKRSYLTSLINSRDHAKANVATFRVVGKSLPFPLVILEKHPYSSQMFIPFSSALKYLVIVALDKNDQPDLSTLTAFISDTSVGFNYKEGIWHSPMVAIGEGYVDFLSITYEIENDPLNTIECEISPIQIDLNH